MEYEASTCLQAVDGRMVNAHVENKRLSWKYEGMYVIKVTSCNAAGKVCVTVTLDEQCLSHVRWKLTVLITSGLTQHFIELL
jgi:hypothetical protein